MPQPVYKDSRAESTLHDPHRTAVARERRIVREKRKRFHKGLRNERAIERVRVVEQKPHSPASPSNSARNSSGNGASKSSG